MRQSEMNRQNQHHRQHHPNQRQYHSGRCNGPLQVYKGYYHVGQNVPHPAGYPIYDQYGRIVNMPPNLRTLQNPPPFLPQYEAPYYQHQQQPPPSDAQQFHQIWDKSTFALSYGLHGEQNAMAREFFQHCRNSPLLPENMIPRRIIFVYDRPEGCHPPAHLNLVKNPYYQPQNHGRQTADAAVGEFSVVRYDAETQTEWREQGGDKSRLHKTPTPSAAKAPTSKPNLAKPVPKFNTNVWKVVEWLKYTNSLVQEPYPNYENTVVPLVIFPRHLKTAVVSPLHGNQTASGNDLKKRAVPSPKNVTVELEVKEKRSVADVVDGDDDEKSGEEKENNQTGLAGEKVEENEACLLAGQESPGAGDSGSESAAAQTSGFVDSQLSHDEEKKEEASQADTKPESQE